MRLYGLITVLLVAVLSLGLIIAIGCGGDDDDDDSGSDDDATGDDDDGGGDYEPGSGYLSAYVRDFQTKAEVQGAIVELVDNATGIALGSAWKTESASGEGQGYVEFTNVPDELDQVGVRVTKEGNHPTYQYYFDVGSVDEEFLLVSRSTSSLVAGLLGLALDPEAGFAAGAIYWGDPSDENPVGCAVVQTDPDPIDGIYYFGPDNLPNPARNVDPNVPENAANSTGVNPQNGYWIGINIAAGTTVDVTATGGTNRDVVESVTIPMSFPDSVTIANIYYSFGDYSANPQGSWCTE
ncbi:MAG: hypothetical protein P9L99_11400 [Candidatus Lernaella stagnicola]|nr:hypothetical protein [Candidatus Lernaella stagnicola]